jgi:hypothetical protein
MAEIVIKGTAYPLPQFDDLTMREWQVFKRNGVEDVPALGARVFTDPDAMISMVEIVKQRAGEKFDPATISELRLRDLDFRGLDATDGDAEASDPPTQVEAPVAAIVGGEQPSGG